MRKGHLEIIQAFVAGDSRRESMGRFSTDGNKVWSYAMLVAKREGNKVFVCQLNDGPTKTTKDHIRALLSQVPGAVEVPANKL